ncbi:DUF58 domain-containing protein [Psychromonas sp.]|uniref:DUF58 domain-containing protein n=1 Tax=Psychromonas sp. TaxID=1884585 RepID=UPI003567911A
MSFILWLLGTSYQNNLVLALSYLLISLIVVAIFHTYANLAGLEIKVLGGKPAFVGEKAYFSLQVEGWRAKGYDNIIIRWWHGEDGCFDFAAKQTTQIQVGVETHKRGILQPGKLLIESVYPLGIIRCWTWLNLDASTVIFPKPLKVDFPAQLSTANDSEQGEQFADGDDFSGLREYRAGDPVKHIAWKHYAREQGLYSKEYASSRSHDNCLDWDKFSHLHVEERLRALCYWALQFEGLQKAYGLRLPGKQIPPALGDGHRLSVLSALACFDINQSDV